MAGIFDRIRVYASEWEELNSRKFTDEECAAISKVTVVASGWGLSACFLMAGGKSYIPLEPSAKVEIGEEIEMGRLELVSLKYHGNNAAIKNPNVLRVRVQPKAVQATDFDNPFGL